MKTKAIQIWKNLTQTLNRLRDQTDKVESVSTAYANTRVSKDTLLKKRRELVTKYNLTEKDLK